MHRSDFWQVFAVAALGLLTLAGPLMVVIDEQAADALVTGRIADAARLATTAVPVLTGTDSTDADLSQAATDYDRATGVRVVVLNHDGTELLASRAGLAPLEHGDQHVTRALSGTASATTGPRWPWSGAPLLVAVPVEVGGQVVGVVVTRSSTAALRAREVWSGLLILVVCAGLAGAAAALQRLRERGVLRPLDELDGALRGLSVGRLRERFAPASGPPEIRRLADSFDAMADRVSEVIQQQQTFVSYASHQLRAPLGTLRLRADAVTRHLPPDGAAEQALLIEEIDRLRAICDGLLAFSRTEAMAGEVQEVDVAAVMARRAQAWRPLAERAGIHLVRRDDPSTPIRVAEEVLTQCLDALIDNALKFAGAGARISLEIHRDAEHVDLHVIDDGPGMSPGALARASGRFWRGGGDGSGLGLAIVASLLSAAGGHLHLGSAHPHGVDACIRLPMISWRGDRNLVR